MHVFTFSGFSKGVQNCYDKELLTIPAHAWVKARYFCLHSVIHSFCTFSIHFEAVRLQHALQSQVSLYTAGKGLFSCYQQGKKINL